MTTTTDLPDAGGGASPAAGPPASGGGAPGRLAGWCYDRRRLVLGCWVVALVTMSVLSGIVGSNYQDKLGGGASQAQKARDLLAERLPGQQGDTAEGVFRTDGSITDPQTQAAVEGVLAGLDGLPHVSSVRSPFDPGAEGQISPGGQIAYARVQFDDDAENISIADSQKILAATAAPAGSGLRVNGGGPVIGRADPPAPGPAELIGIVAAMII